MKSILIQIKHFGYLLSLLLVLYLFNIYKLGFLFSYPIIILFAFKRKFIKKNLDSTFIILVLYSLIYSVFYALNPVMGFQYFFVYAISPPLFYLVGQFLCLKSINENSLFFIFLVIGATFSLPALFSILINIREGGLGQIDRSIPMFWNPNGEGIAATVMGSFFTLNMCIPAILIKRPPKLKKSILLAMILLFAFSLLCILRIGTRTQIGISLITLSASLIYIVPKQTLKQNITMFLLFFLGLIIIFNNVSFDLKSDWLLAFADRMGDGANSNLSSGGGRTERWIKSIEYIFEKPLGWGVEEFGNSHNLWFDVLRVTGIIPFTLLIIFSLKSFFNIRKVVRINKNLFFFNNQMRTYPLAFFLIFMVEPVIEGMFPLFILFCIYIGIVNKYIKMHTSLT